MRPVIGTSARRHARARARLPGLGPGAAVRGSRASPPIMANSTAGARSPSRPRPARRGEIPVDKIKVPRGFKVSLWAHGINNARAMAWGDKGTLFVSSRVAGNVYAVVDRGGRREVKVIAKGLNLPNGVAFKDGTLYVAEVSRITKMVGIEDKLDNPPAMEVVYDILPRDLPHGWKYLAFGPDGKLYFNIGAPCNICMPPDTHANISRVNPDGTGFEYVAHGVRNSVGFDWHPVTKELYFATHGRDWLGRRRAERPLRRGAEEGPALRLPVLPPGRHPRSRVRQGPLVRGVRAAAAQDRPARGRQRRAVLHRLDVPAPSTSNRIFLAQRGSWNRSEKVGFRVMMVTLRPRDVPKYEVFAEGWLQGDQIWGRPGLHPADEGRLAADRGRLRGRDLPGRLPALTPARLALGVAAVGLLLAATAAPGGRSRGGAPQGRRPARPATVRTATRPFPARPRSPGSPCSSRTGSSSSTATGGGRTRRCRRSPRS